MDKTIDLVLVKSENYSIHCKLGSVRELINLTVGVTRQNT